MGRRIHAVLVTLFLTLLLRPALAGPIFSGSQDTVQPGSAVRVSLSVTDIQDLEALTVRVSFTSPYLAFDTSLLTLNSSTGTYDLNPSDEVVLGKLTENFLPLLAPDPVGSTNALLASLAGSGDAVTGTGTLLLIPMWVDIDASAGDYFVDFACVDDPPGQTSPSCNGMVFTTVQAKITVPRQKVVPEPTILGLLALGLTTLLCMRRF